MLKQKLKTGIEQLVGKILNNFNLACEMMMFEFEGHHIHAQCFSRIIYNDNVLFTTLDYQNWDVNNEQNNDEWYNFAQYKNTIVNNKVLKAELTNTNDLLICLENNISIQIYISNGLPHFEEDYEQWRYFSNESKQSHLVIYSKTIEE